MLLTLSRISFYIIIVPTFPPFSLLTVLAKIIRFTDMF